MPRLPRLFSRLLSIALLLLLLAACNGAAPPAQVVTTEAPPQPAAPTETPAPTATLSPEEQLAGLPFDDFVDESYRQLLLREPEYLTELGMSAQFGLRDDRLNDISDAYLRETQQLESDIYDLLQTYDRAALSPDQQVTYDVYAWYLDDLVRGHPYLYYDYPITFFITGVQNQTLFLFTDIHPIQNKQNVEDYLTRLEQVPVKFDQLIDGLQRREQAGIIAPRLVLQWSLRDIQNVASSPANQTPFYTALRDKLAAAGVFAEAEQTAALAQAEPIITASVQPAYQALAQAVSDQLSRAPQGVGVSQYPDGAAYYDYLLRHHTTTDLTAEQVHELGLREVKRIQAEIRTLLAQLGYPAEEELVTAFQRVALDSGTVPGGELVAAYEALINGVQGLMPNYFNRLPAAQVVVIGGDTGGFYVAPSVDGTRPGAFYAAVNGSEPRYTLATLTYHETVPGHHTQSALAQELDQPLMRRDVFFTGYIEGWALYAEQLAQEMGLYASDPNGDLGRLQYELFRAVRLVVDTGLHAKGWSYEQAVQYMQENTGFGESFSAISPEFEVARYVAWPGQATAYKIGMLNILQNRQKASDALGGAFDLKAFHSVVLENGPVPLAVLDRLVEAYIQNPAAGTP